MSKHVRLRKSPINVLPLKLCLRVCAVVIHISSFFVLPLTFKRVLLPKQLDSFFVVSFYVGTLVLSIVPFSSKRKKGALYWGIYHYAYSGLRIAESMEYQFPKEGIL